MDGDDYTNVIEMLDNTGKVRIKVCVWETHSITYTESNSAECTCGEKFHGVLAEDLDELVDEHLEGVEPREPQG